MASSFSFDAIGTSWTIDIVESLSSEKEERLLALIHERIEKYDRAYSRFRPDSVVSRMAESAGTYDLPEDSAELFALYREIYECTAGKVTPLIGDVLIAAGYDATYSLRQQRELRAPIGWDDVFLYEPHRITLHMPSMLDVGAGGKGHLVDIVGRLLEKEGILSYVVDAGGDIRQRTTFGRPLRVGLEDPRDTTSVLGIVEIQNQSICGSAGNRRAWDGFHHIIDPFSLTSPKDISAVWVIADSTFLADMLTTALFFVPPDTLVSRYAFSFAIVYADGTYTQSVQFPGEFFSTEHE